MEGMTMIYDYIIYTDGAYSRKNDEGAFAFIILDGNGEEIKHFSKKIVGETNNRAELKAIIAAIYHLPLGAKFVKVISDSMYALNTLSGKWARNANADLFEVWDKILSTHDYEIEYEWVKGHSGDEHNDFCDALCNDALGYDANAEYEKYKRK